MGRLLGKSTLATRLFKSPSYQGGPIDFPRKNPGSQQEKQVIHHSSSGRSFPSGVACPIEESQHSQCCPERGIWTTRMAPPGHIEAAHVVLSIAVMYPQATGNFHIKNDQPIGWLRGTTIHEKNVFVFNPLQPKLRTASILVRDKPINVHEQHATGSELISFHMLTRSSQPCINGVKCVYYIKYINFAYTYTYLYTR